MTVYRPTEEIEAAPELVISDSTKRDPAECHRYPPRRELLRGRPAKLMANPE